MNDPTPGHAPDPCLDEIGRHGSADVQTGGGADEVRRALESVLDPELGVNIVELGMVHDVTVTPEGSVRVGVSLTTAACPLRGQIGSEVRARVMALDGVRDVEIDYAEMSQAERSALMERARLAASRSAPATAVPARTRVIAVASGKGGVGKSSITANIAADLAAAGHTVGVLDADIWGFSIPRMLGVDGRLAGVHADDGRGRILPHDVRVASTSDGAAGARAHEGRMRVVSMGLLVDDEDTALMWRGPVLAKALEQFLCDVEWGDLDYLLLDMPPGTGDIQMALARLLPRAEMLVVTTPAMAAQQVAARVADMARRSHLHVLGIVENMSEFVAPDGSRHSIFGSGGGERLAAMTGAPLLGCIPVEAAVSEGGDSGRPVVLDDPPGPAGSALHSIGERLATELLPPVQMAGCTARMLEAVAAL